MAWLEISMRSLAIVMVGLLSGAVFAQSQTEPAPRTRPGERQPAQPESNSTQPAEAPRQLSPRRRERANQLRIPDEVQIVRDVVYSTAKTDEGEPVELKFDAAFLKESDGKPMPVIMYIHGGGWHSGSRQSGLQQAVAFAMGGYFAVTIDYRLSDQAKFPAAV